MARFPLQYIDLFAGCGGLSTGLHLSGWKELFAVERNPAAFAPLKADLVDGRKHFDWADWSLEEEREATIQIQPPIDEIKSRQLNQ